MRLLERIFDKLRWPDPKPTEGILIEDQIGVLKAIAEQPGSIIKGGPASEPYRAGKPLRYRTVERLLGLEELRIGRDLSGIEYITLTARGWDRITVKLDP